MSKCKVIVADTDAKLDALARAVVDGRISIDQIMFGGCPKCGGKLRSDPTPNWMNRWICNVCGKATSQ